MVETARRLVHIPDKTIVLVGAMQPAPSAMPSLRYNCYRPGSIWR